MSSYKHGESPEAIRTKEYNIWRIMRQRCNNSNNKGFKNYGGRGIKCCERWEEYLNFLDDMGRCPPNFGIERENVNGDYSPDNCSWKPLDVQSRNRRWVIEVRNRGSCKRGGHPWTEKSTGYNKAGYKICKICDRERIAARRSFDGR